MVTAATSFSRSGVSDWLIQRFTAVILAAYTVFMVTFLVVTPELTFEVWQALFAQLWFRIFSLLTLLSIVAHGWIGLWVVLTDYITEYLIGASALIIRLSILTLYAIVNIACIVWGIEILWGI